MLAIVRNNQKDAYLPLLQEDAVYSISNFKVVPGPKFYRAVDTDLSITFFHKTQIRPETDTDIVPHYKFELQSFENVNKLVDKVKCLIG